MKLTKTSQKAKQYQLHLNERHRNEKILLQHLFL